jgi:hypothetical protein
MHAYRAVREVMFREWIRPRRVACPVSDPGAGLKQSPRFIQLHGDPVCAGAGAIVDSEVQYHLT